MSRAYTRPRSRRAPEPTGPTLDDRIDGVLLRTVAAGLLAAMRRDERPWGEIMVARHLLRHSLGPEHVEAVMHAMVAGGLVWRVPGAAMAWQARRGG